MPSVRNGLRMPGTSGRPISLQNGPGTDSAMPNERILFVTGRLAEKALRRVLETLSNQAGFDYDVCVLGISVAALMHVDWVRRKLHIEGRFDRVILPGWCHGELHPLNELFGLPFERGPKTLHDIPCHFGSRSQTEEMSDDYDIEILAEINHAPRLTDREILRLADRFSADGADVIDLGSVPGERWTRAGEVTRMLCDEGHRVSIDSFDRFEVEAAVQNGAELVLSCNSQNVQWAAGLDAELVVIPDETGDPHSLEQSIDVLRGAGAAFRVDPVLEPIGFGFAASLRRYFDVRAKWPDVEILMGIGNLTELTEVDTAGVNVVLAALCQELGIRSVLTTEVINWAQTAVREFDLARRLVLHSIDRHVLPKHLDGRLVMLRDPRVTEFSDQELKDLSENLSDPNFRLFLAAGKIHLMNRDGYWHGTDPFELFDRITEESKELTPAHAFYLGYELSKAATALTLGKQYTQDEALSWGLLTSPEQGSFNRHAHERRSR